MFMMKKKNKMLKSFCMALKAMEVIKFCAFLKIAVVTVAFFLLICNVIKMSMNGKMFS